MAFSGGRIELHPDTETPSAQEETDYPVPGSHQTRHHSKAPVTTETLLTAGGESEENQRRFTSAETHSSNRQDPTTTEQNSIPYYNLLQIESIFKETLSSLGTTLK